MNKLPFSKLALDITEEEYRSIPYYNYSLLSSFENMGPKVLKDGEYFPPSDRQIIGSLVDCLLTTPDKIDDLFYYQEINKPTDAMCTVLQDIYNKTNINKFSEIPNEIILDTLIKYNYYNNYKPETKLNKVKTEGEDYYNILSIIKDKFIITKDQLEDAKNAVETLKTHEYTKHIFETGDGIELLFQPKFSVDIDGYKVKGMMDIIKVDHNTKSIKIYDLKVTSLSELDFDKAVINYNYYIQATLYSQIIKELINYYKEYIDYTISCFSFIIINEKNLTPIIWDFMDYLWEEEFITKYKQVKKSWRQLIDEIEWHKEKNNFSYPRYIIENKGKVLITSIIAKID